jgi:mannosyltransferase OCH1-like enzyme
MLTDSLSLQEHGGIYLDIDTFILSSFKEAGLLAQDFVLGMEAQPLDFEYGFEEDEMSPKGLCNAIIVARKGSSFLEKWIQSYEWFDPDIWSDHSVVSDCPGDSQKRWLLKSLYHLREYLGT